MQRGSKRAAGIIELVERAVVPSGPAAALTLAAAVVELDAIVFERAGDSDGQLGDVFRRACALFGTAAQGCPRAAVIPLALRLWSDNGYGARDELLVHTVAGLDETGRAELIAALRRQLPAGGSEPSNPALFGLMTIADAIADPALYEEACCFGDRSGHPVFRVQVAQRYLRAGRTTEALERLPATAAECGGYASEWQETRIALLRALGRTDEMRELLWSQFKDAPNKTRLDAWLDSVSEAQRPAMLAQARAEVMLERHPPEIQAQYFIDLGDPATAANCILSRSEQCDGERYNAFGPIADTLAGTHPLEASALYRKLLEANLTQGRSKYYGHGARYWQALAQLAPRITHWDPLVPHATYVESIRTQHARKPAFWARVAGRAAQYPN